MSDQQFEHAVRDWLEDGSDRTPPTAIDVVLFAVKTTPQERDLRIPRRFTLMPTYMRLAAGIALVAILGAGTVLLLSRGPSFGTTPTPTPTAAVGTIDHTSAFAHPFEYRFTEDGNAVEASRDRFEYWATESPSAAVVWVVREYLDDPCRYETSGRRQLEPGVEALIAQLRATSYLNVVEQAGTTVDGHPARVFSVTARTDSGACDAPRPTTEDALRLWPDATDASPGSQHMSLSAGASARLAMFELDRDTLVIETWGDASFLPEADRFIGSIRFQPTPN